MASIPLKIGMVYKGAYSPMTTYDLWNTVQHEGSLHAFIALTPASGKPLPVLPAISTDNKSRIARLEQLWGVQ